MKKNLYLLLVSMRPRQWVKNTFVFAALLFSQSLFHPRMLVTSIEAFATFCMISGGVYILNDFLDIEKDKKHPKKSIRPLASGRLNPMFARIAFVVLIIISLVISFLINLSFGITATGYLVIQIAYSSFLKNVVIADAFCIATGFFLRLVAGAEAIEVPISSWLLICGIFISLFLGLGKRRHEFVTLGKEAGKHRKVLDEYNIALLDQMVGVATSGTVISYSLYTLSQETVRKFNTKNLWFTIPIVLYGIFRYLYLVYRREAGGNPELTLFEDKHLLATIVFYIMLVAVILYF